MARYTAVIQDDGSGFLANATVKSGLRLKPRFMRYTTVLSCESTTSEDNEFVTLVQKCCY